VIAPADMITATAMPSVHVERPSPGVERQPRHGARSAGGYACLWLAIGVVTLSLIGAAYQTVSTRIDPRRLRAPDQLVDVGTHRLHINCMPESG
jgi:hypothetical protein